MTTDVASVEAELAPLVALETMIRRHVNSVPVVDHGRLRGIITSRDFLREFVQLAPRAARTPAAKAISPWRPTIGREASPEEALRQLEAHNARYLGVADGLQAVGVLSLRQLGRARRIELVGFDENDASLIGSCCDTVGDLLGSAAACIEPLRSLGDAAELLCERRADGLAVVEPSGRITGMLTISDLLNVLSLELARRA
jgi:CBS domain-containing protein